MAADTSFLGKIDPNVNEQLMTAQQQLALAQALRGNSLQPISAPPGQNARISPLSALAQVLNGYNSKGMIQDATHNLAGAEAQVGQNRLQMMAQLLGGGSQAPAAPAGGDAPLSSAPQASMPGAAPAAPAAPPQAAPPQAGSVPNPMQDPEWRRMAMAEQLGMMPAGTAEGYAKAKYGVAAPTDQMKNDTWSGVTPQQRAGITTATTMAPDQSRVQVGPDGKPQLAMVAPNPDKNMQFQVGPNGQVAAAPIPGAPAAAASMAGSTEKATADAAIRDVKLPTGEVVPVRAGAAADVGGAQAGVAPAWTGGKLSGIAIQKLELASQRGDKDAAAALTAYNAAQQPRLGQATGAKESIEGMSKKWEELAANNGSSQQAISFLSNIKQLAGTAITGTASDKIAFANGLLAKAGISDRATNAQTATDLLNKNSNRITALLGQGSLGTDAARQVLAAANPNSKMSKQAIADSADDIIGQYRMTQAKANALLSFRNANDAQGYNTAETKFNQVADPRVWRLQAMNPQEAAAYVKTMVPADAADLLQKRTEIMKNGWLQ